MICKYFVVELINVIICSKKILSRRTLPVTPWRNFITGFAFQIQKMIILITLLRILRIFHTPYFIFFNILCMFIAQIGRRPQCSWFVQCLIPPGKNMTYVELRFTLCMKPNRVIWLTSYNFLLLRIQLSFCFIHPIFLFLFILHFRLVFLGFNAIF
jgi:hypothetical protein